MFQDRKDAGKYLAEHVKKYSNNAIVIALPRGGVAVGYEVASSLRVPLDVIVSRKLGAPSNQELGIGAIAEENVFVLDPLLIRSLHLDADEIEKIEVREREEVKHRVLLYRKGKPLPKLQNRTVILVDDGVATGVTARAAIQAIKKHVPKRLIFAVPVCSSQAASRIRPLVDSLICPLILHDLRAIGLYYKNFQQVSDDEVLRLLERSNAQIQHRNQFASGI